jgi:hypothetical protein
MNGIKVLQLSYEAKTGVISIRINENKYEARHIPDTTTWKFSTTSGYRRTHYSKTMMDALDLDGAVALATTRALQHWYSMHKNRD